MHGQFCYLPMDLTFGFFLSVFINLSTDFTNNFYIDYKIRGLHKNPWVMKKIKRKREKQFDLVMPTNKKYFLSCLKILNIIYILKVFYSYY